MSNCSDPNNENNVGCRNGQLYCNDPRCFPNCEGCSANTSSGNWIIIMIILILLGVLLIMGFIIGYDWYNKTKKAAEPKNLTVNKHIHNIQQPPVVVNPTVVPAVPVETAIAVPTTAMSVEPNISTRTITVEAAAPMANSMSDMKITTNSISLSMDEY